MGWSVPSKTGATQQLAWSASTSPEAWPSYSTVASVLSWAKPANTLAFCSWLTKAPMRTVSWRGLPTVVLASLAAIAAAAALYSARGTKMRRMAVHF